jgi:hypothetical protein
MDLYIGGNGVGEEEERRIKEALNINKKLLIPELPLFNVQKAENDRNSTGKKQKKGRRCFSMPNRLLRCLH